MIRLEWINECVHMLIEAIVDIQPCRCDRQTIVDLTMGVVSSNSDILY